MFTGVYPAGPVILTFCSNKLMLSVIVAVIFMYPLISCEDGVVVIFVMIGASVDTVKAVDTPDVKICVDELT